jgi:hypothetical protein
MNYRRTCRFRRLWTNADCAENQGEHAPEADEGREVKTPDYEHLEPPFNGASQDAKTHHQSHVLPG